MYAIIETGSKQYRVEPGAAVQVEKLDAAVGAAVTFGRVLLVSNNGQVAVGAPVVQNASVVGEVVRHGREPKIIVFKKIRRKNYRRTHGHRQGFTEVKITEIRAA
ncbi:MAG: 50S ribosomal protein L21 [Nitrospirota bacterium]